MARYQDISLSFGDLIDTPVTRRQKVEEASRLAQQRLLATGGPFAALASGIAGSIPGITENVRTTARDAGFSGFETPGERLGRQLAQINTNNYAGEQAAADLLQRSGFPVRANVARSQAIQNELARRELTRPEIVSASEIVEGRLIQRDPQTGKITSTFVLGEEGDFIPETLRNQELGKVSVSMQKLREDAAETASSYGKLQGLKAGMDKGDRSAINSAIMLTARLISPGVVTDADFNAYSGAETSFEVLNNFFTGAGFTKDQILRIFDPTNPDTFDPDQLLRTANAAITASIPAILQSKDDQRSIAEALQAPGAYLTAQFESLGSFDNLEKILEELPDQPTTGSVSTLLQLPDLQSAQTFLETNETISEVIFTDANGVRQRLVRDEGGSN